MWDGAAPLSESLVQKAAYKFNDTYYLKGYKSPL